MHIVDDACVTLWRAPEYVAPEPGDGDSVSPFAPGVQERFRILGELMGAHPHDRPHWYLNALCPVGAAQGRQEGTTTYRRGMTVEVDAGAAAHYVALQTSTSALTVDDLVIRHAPEAVARWRTWCQSTRAW